MFKYEKEMIPVLEQEFVKKYSNASMIREFNSGNGIADLTIAVESDVKPTVSIKNYSEMYYLTNFFNRKGKRIFSQKLIKENKLDKKTLYTLIKKLIKGNYLIQQDESYVVLELYKPSVKRFIAIEAKLNKWKEGFYQASRYRCFSHKSYLALPHDKIKNVDIDMLSAYKIGLISVFKDMIKIINNPPLQSPKNITAYYHLTESVII